MDKPDTAMPPGSTADRLGSWKKIAAHLKRDVTTVQRWEKREAMPVHRHQHDKSGSVYAYRWELDAWAQSRRDLRPLGLAKPTASLSEPAHPPPARPGSRVPKTAATIGLAMVLLVAASIGWLVRADRFWKNPIAAAVYEPLTGFDGENEAAAVSRDGQFVAFLSDRDGRTDVWIMQIGSGEPHNLTRGMDGELVNPAVRTLEFSPDGTQLMFWHRSASLPPGQGISIWSVPTLGGEPKPFLAGVAEAAWSPDGNQLAYHTPGPGDPLYISDGKGLSPSRPIMVAPAGLHSHFPVWAVDNQIYFVKGTLPDELDVWRIAAQGGEPERITMQATHLTYPVLIDRRTLLYLANAPDGSGPWIYGMDTERRVPHQLTTGVEQYTSLAASADGHRLIATVSEPQRTLWRVAIDDAPASETSPVRMSLATGSGSTPRLGPNYLLYVAASDTGDSIWKVSGTAATQLWSANGARLVGHPAISTDGRWVAFSAVQRGQTRLYSMESDGSGARIVSDTLELRGSPAWAPDGKSLTSAAVDRGAPHLFRIPLDGARPTPLLQPYSVDPSWSPDGNFVIFSGPDVGTTFPVSAATATGTAYPMPPLTLSRGARHLALLAHGDRLVFLQGEIHHKDLWMLELKTGALQRLTHLPADFNVRDFDISADGHEAIFEREQTRSSVVAIERPY